MTVVTPCPQALIDISTEQRWLSTARTTMSLVQSIVQVRGHGVWRQSLGAAAPTSRHTELISRVSEKLTGWYCHLGHCAE